MNEKTSPTGRAAAFVFAAALAVGLSYSPGPAVALTGGSSGSSWSSEKSAKSLTQAQKLIDQKDYDGAIDALEKLAKNDKNNADAFNLLGYSHRKLGEFGKSLTNYQKALAIDPKHQSANEYIGELYLQTGELAKAEERLAALRGICGESCEAYRDLQEAIAAHKQKATN